MSAVENRGNRREIKAQSSTNRETVSERVKSILEKVQNMSSEEYTAMIKSLSSTKLNKYSLNNQILLFFQGATQAASFSAWKKLGRNVKKGEKGLVIVAPIKRSFWAEVEDKETGEIKKVKKEFVKGFKDTYVFDISQTEGKEIERGMTTKSELKLETAIKATQKLNFTVHHRAMSIRTGGYIADRDITLNSALSTVENTATLLHELAHGVLGHQADRRELAKQQKEFEAETVTALLCSDFGIDRNSTIYLKSWEATEELIEDIKIIDRAYKQIKEALEE